MKPFNLEEAMAGKPVLTRSGRDAKILYVYDGAQCLDYPVYAEVDGVTGLTTYTKSGAFEIGKEWCFDLFMKTETHTAYAPVYEYDSSNWGKYYRVGSKYDNKEDVPCTDYISEVSRVYDAKFVGIATITWEV